MRHLFLLLLLLAPAWGQTLDHGKVELPFGMLYVPEGLTWKTDKTADKMVLTGRGTDRMVSVIALPTATTIKEPEIISLLQAHLPELGRIKLKATLPAPYPWPDSQELRLDQKTPCSVYAGSGSGRTLVIAVSGRSAAEVANSIAASFKENFQVRRESRTRGEIAPRVQSMLGTGVTLLLMVGFLVPVGLVIFTNRRRGEKQNPYKAAITGLVVALGLALVLEYTVLSRFSWTGFGDYGAALGGCFARFAFVMVISLYLSRRWERNIELSE